MTKAEEPDIAEPPPPQPDTWRRAYEEFCAAMDWTGDDPRTPQLFPREDG